IENLNWALEKMKEENISHIFALGDYSSAFTVERLQVDDVPVHAVWGNCDGDKQSMINSFPKINPNITFSKYDFEEIEIETKKYFITHYPQLAENAAKSLDYDAVFHGHTHEKRNEKIGNTPIINPGKLAIYPHDEISFAIFDSETKEVKFIVK
ncbi:MAG: YfcE family phosphodiesterase, partial [Patescibacteria group bacterium]